MTRDDRSMASAIQDAQANGWASFPTRRPHTISELTALIHEAGHFSRINNGNSFTEQLSPRDSQASRRPSLSASFGTGAFPLHVDGAVEAIPPRFVLLYCIRDEQRRPTLLCGWKTIRDAIRSTEQLMREVFWYRNGRRSLADTIVDRERRFVRFDATCMVPATRSGRDVLDKISLAIRGIEVVHHEWLPQTALLIDNWSVLHGRADAQCDGTRVLLRVAFD